MMKRYKILVVDAAWRFQDNLPGNRGVDKKYKSTMSFDQLRSLNIPPTEPDALLFFWRVASMVPESYDIIRAWGFTHKSEFAWVKTQSYKGLEPPSEPDPPGRMGLGHYVRNEHEVCIIASKGSGCQLIDGHAVRSVFFAPRPKKHSEKPAIFFELLDKLLGSVGPRAELFARDPRDGYDTFGDEIGSELSFGLLP